MSILNTVGIENIMVEGYVFYINWHLGVANKPALCIDTLELADYIDNVIWDFVKVLDENGEVSYYIKAEVLPGVWSFWSICTRTIGGMKGSCGREMSFTLSDGTTLTSDNCWSSNSKYINEIFALEGDKRLMEVGSYAIEYGFYKHATGCLGYDTFETKGYICPSLSDECVSKEGAEHNEHVSEFFRSMTFEERSKYYANK